MKKRATVTPEPQAGPDPSQYKLVNTADLPEGVKLRLPISDSSNVLLVAPGVALTPVMVARLQRRGITAIQVHPSDLSKISAKEGTNEARESGSAGEANDGTEMPRAGRLQSGAFLKQIKRHGTQPFGEAEREHFIQDQKQSVQQVAQLFASIESIRAEEMQAFEGLSASALTKIAEDVDLFVSLGISPSADKYPARHSHQTAMLALAIGANLGYDKKSLIELGMGCLAHDIGMLHINRSVYENPAILDNVAFLEITKHPSITFDMMRSVERIAGTSRLVAYQMHERCDGSGYPRCRLENQIHPLSKIAAVADVFVALVSPRPHRPAVMPYYAMEHILHGAQQRLFGRQAVQGLLRTVSLFPLGSYVELSDGRVGRVLRTNGIEYTRPIIEAWQRDGSQTEPEIVDLVSCPELVVTRPLGALPPEIRCKPIKPEQPAAEAAPPEASSPEPAIPEPATPEPAAEAAAT